MRNIDLINQVTTEAAGNWPYILHSLSIAVPDNPRKHAPCPHCGGNDRFRFDDKGKGSHICNHCGAGDGLDLIKKVNNCDTTEAAKLVADVLNIDCRVSELDPIADQKRRDELTTKRTKQAEARRKREELEKAERKEQFNRNYSALSTKATTGESEYLIAKGLNGIDCQLLPDGSILLPLTDSDENIVSAQTISEIGSKKLVAGSSKQGSYHAVNAPDDVQTIILAEGYASALSVSLMRPEALTVAAIDAGNLTPVAEVMRSKYPRAQIIIAADNDYHDDEPNTGELAAIKAAKAVSGWLTMPQGDHKADWDDYRQQYGLDAATRAFNEGLYQPEGTSMTATLQVIDGGKEDKKQGDPLKPHVKSRKDGVYWITPKVDKVSGEVINNASWLASPLEVIGTGRDDKDQYLILRWHPYGEKETVTAPLPLADIGEREGWRTLKAGGVNITTKGSLRAILADWLQMNGNREIWRVSHATGWQCGAYIMPDGEIIGEPERPVLFSGRSSAASGYKVKGSAESWRDSVARLAAGNYSMMTGIAAALAAPMIGLSGAEGFGIHFYQQSSAGKTTTANTAASLYGDPDTLRLTWYGTALGLANEAAAHNDGLMPLDEVGQGADPVSVSQSAYALFNGVGKLQGAKEGGNRDLKRWRTMAISTGEMDMETFIATSGRKTKAGQLVRLLNIPMSKSVRFHEYQTGKQHADALKDAYQNHYGAAGREWIKWLASNQSQAVETIRECEERWRNMIPAEYGEQVHRVGARFAILESALLTGRVITGWDEQTCRDAIQHSYNAWLMEFGTGNKEHQQIIEQAEAFLNSYGLSRFAPLTYDPRDLPIQNLAGYRSKGTHDDDPITFYTFRSTFEKEMANGFNPKQFADVLKQAGMLKPPSSGRGYQGRIREGGRQIRVYVLTFNTDEADLPE